MSFHYFRLINVFIESLRLDQIKRHVRDGAKHLYTILLVPRTSALVTRVLEEEGVLGEVTISSFNMQLIPLEDDLISLEHDNAFKEIWVVRLFSTVILPYYIYNQFQDGDETAVYDSAQALITFQKLFGLFPRILGKGDSAGVRLFIIHIARERMRMKLSSA